eukprot:jgi/Mesvir1/20118/Mv13357-RA.1
MRDTGAMEDILTSMSRLKKTLGARDDRCDSARTEHEQVTLDALKNAVRNQLLTEELADSIDAICRFAAETDSRLHRIGGPLFWRVVVTSLVSRAGRLPENERTGYVFHGLMKAVAGETGIKNAHGKRV